MQKQILILAVATILVVLVFILTFVLSLKSLSSSAAPSSSSKSSANDQDGNQEEDPQQQQEDVNSKSFSSRVQRRPRLYQKLEKEEKRTLSKFDATCTPASSPTALSRFAEQSKFFFKLNDLCRSYCVRVDKNKYPPEVSSSASSSSWRPPFCTKPKEAYRIPRMDHGCYYDREEKRKQVQRFQQERGEEEEEEEDEQTSGGGNKKDKRRKEEKEEVQEEHQLDEDKCVTAVFSAITDRFYGLGGQEYVWESIRQWRLFHPSSSSSSRKKSSSSCENKIFVIMNSSQLESGDRLVQRNASRFDVQLVGHEKLMSDEWRRYERVFYVQGYMHPGGSRKTGHKNFNKLISARFFAIESLMRKYKLKNVVCLENDMMVYTNFAETVSAIRNKCGWRMASIIPHFKGVIPGLLYIRNATEIGRFARFINDLLSCGFEFGIRLGNSKKDYANDMTYLMNYYQLNGGEYLGNFPNSIHKKGENCLADHFPSLIHDGASFGQWYSFAIKKSPPFELPSSSSSSSGQDPDEDQRMLSGSQRNLFVTSGRGSWEPLLEKHFSKISDGTAVSSVRPPEHIRNAMKGRFVDATPGELVKWKRDSKGRLVPFWGSLKLSSLHIHAKNLFWFRSK